MKWWFQMILSPMPMDHAACWIIISFSKLWTKIQKNWNITPIYLYDHKPVGATIKPTKPPQILTRDDVPNMRQKWIENSHKATETELANGWQEATLRNTPTRGADQMWQTYVPQHIDVFKQLHSSIVMSLKSAASESSHHTLSWNAAVSEKRCFSRNAYFR